MRLQLGAVGVYQAPEGLLVAAARCLEQLRLLR
jgi:hypothetical protein